MKQFWDRERSRQFVSAIVYCVTLAHMFGPHQWNDAFAHLMVLSVIFLFPRSLLAGPCAVGGIWFCGAAISTFFEASAYIDQQYRLISDLILGVVLFFLAFRNYSAYLSVRLESDVSRESGGWWALAAALLSAGVWIAPSPRSTMQIIEGFGVCLGPMLCLAIGLIVPRRILPKTLMVMSLLFVFFGTIPLFENTETVKGGFQTQLAFCAGYWFVSLILILIAALERQKNKLANLPPSKERYKPRFSRKR